MKDDARSSRRKSPFRAAFGYRDVRLLIGSSAVSQMGDWLYNIGLIVYVFDKTGSPEWVAAAGVGRMLPYLVLSAHGGGHRG